jgi:hypothetical protein
LSHIFFHVGHFLNHRKQQGKDHLAQWNRKESVEHSFRVTSNPFSFIGRLVVKRLCQADMIVTSIDS